MCLPQEPGHVHVEYGSEVDSILTAEELTTRGLQLSDIGPGDPLRGPNISPEDWGVCVLLTNGKVFGCDLVVSATGASPNTSCLSSPSGHMEVRGVVSVAWRKNMLQNISVLCAACSE